MPEPITDDPDATTTTPSGKKVVLPPPRGQSSDMYNADPADGGDDSPHTSDFLKRFDPDATKGLTDQLSGIERQRGAAEQKQLGELSGQMARDRAQMETAFHAEAQSANSIPPQWNADQERKERETGPIESFASIGSIFGLLASAFTKTPLTSALNASAAAMNSIHQHDEEGYKSAYEAWKENTALALKRFGMEREMFEDTNKLISTDLEGWKIKQLAIAAQFDNKKAIAMLDAGMDDKIIEMQAAQVRAAEGVIKAREDWETYDIKRTIFKAQTQAWDKDHPDAKPQERAKARLDILQGVGTDRYNVQENLLRDFRLQKGEKTSAEDEADFLAQHNVGRIGGAGGAPTKEKEVARRVANFVKKNPDATDDEVDAEHDKAEKEVADSAQPSMTPHDRSVTQRDVVQYDQAIDTIHAAIKTLQTYQFSAGLAGKATRGAERIENIFGSNQTARDQFMRDIQFIRANAGKLLFDRSGRPLAADSERINDIIGGISMGDTTANSITSLQTALKRLEELQSNRKQQLQGDWTPDRTTRKRGTSISDPTKSTWQDEAIPVGPHVDIGTPQGAGQ